MKVYVMWHGGSSYALGDVEKDLEVFDSLGEAMAALREREVDGFAWKQTFIFADGRIEHVFTPCTDKTSSMLVYLSDPREAHDPYPDREIKFGPRGGVITERT